jgi:carboxymethylenebutenolidase
MKRVACFIVLLAVIVTGASGQSCCSRPGTAEFAALGADKAFISSHASPLPFTFNAAKGKMITFTTGDGKDGKAFEVLADKQTSDYLLLFHEWWGLNDYIKQEAERLQKELSVNVVAIDLYDGKTTSDPEEAGNLMKQLSNERAESIINGAIAYIGKTANIHTMGWCIGGGWSLQAAILAGKQAKSCVLYYGMPESDPVKLKKLEADVLGLFATRDKWINEEVVNKFQQNMDAAGKKLSIMKFEADHAFANPSNPNYDKAAAAEANKQARNFLKGHFE